MQEISGVLPKSDGFLSRYFRAAGNVWDKMNDKEWNEVNMKMEAVWGSGGAVAIPYIVFDEINKESRRLKGIESHIS